MNYTKALILVDYINEIVHPDGKISGSAVMINKYNVIENCNKVLDYARKNSWLIIWVKVGFEEGYPEVHPNSPIFSGAKLYNALAKNSWGTELHSGLNFKENELVIYKNRINPFYATNLELILKANNIDEILLAGVSTEWAIEAAARDAHDKNFKITIIEDLCASGDEEFHKNTIKVMSRIAKIIKHTEIE